MGWRDTSRHGPDGPDRPGLPTGPADPPSRWWVEEALHRRVIVHTSDDRSIEGVLSRDRFEDGVLLWGAKLLGKPEIALEGEVFVPRSQVLFIQTVTQ